MAHSSGASRVDPSTVRSQLQNFFREAQQHPCITLERVWQGGPSRNILIDGRTFEELATRYKTLPTFLPRKGELVLFYNNQQPHIREETTQFLLLFDEALGMFLGFPAWRAGVVAQEPGDVPSLEDLSPPSNRHLEAGDKAYRIDLYPDPDSEDKTLSNHSYVVKLNRIRPLNMFHEVLSGLPQDKWHGTIHNALKVMSTTCLVEPKCIYGQWPTAKIRCSGIWIGPELFVVGDAVRLMPGEAGPNEVHSALVIECIEWLFDYGDFGDELSSVQICGKELTTNKAMAFQRTPFTAAEHKEVSTSLNGYTWYPTNDFRTEVPIVRIIGRLYESNAMKHLLDVADFDVGSSGVKQARRWAQLKGKNVHQKCDFLFTTDRIEALAIDTLNGLSVNGRTYHRPDSEMTHDDSGRSSKSDLTPGDDEDQNHESKSEENGVNSDIKRATKRPRL